MNILLRAGIGIFVKTEMMNILLRAGIGKSWQNPMMMKIRLRAGIENSCRKQSDDDDEYPAARRHRAFLSKSDDDDDKNPAVRRHREFLSESDDDAALRIAAARKSCWGQTRRPIAIERRHLEFLSESDRHRMSFQATEPSTNG
jgi:hypothetical protein